MNMFVCSAIRSQLLIVICSFLFFGTAFSMQEMPAQEIKSALKKSGAEKKAKSVRFNITEESKCHSYPDKATQPVEVEQPKNNNNSCTACLQISIKKCPVFEGLEKLQGHSQEFGAKGPLSEQISLLLKNLSKYSVEEMIVRARYIDKYLNEIPMRKSYQEKLNQAREYSKLLIDHLK